MKSNKNKTVLLGVTSSIAAYKSCELTRRLIQNNYDVHVVMTPNAAKLVTPLTFQTLSRNPVFTDLFAEITEWRPQHISLAEKGDVLIIAPATANIIAKIAHGICDDALSTTAVAFNGPVIIAPSMNSVMLTSTTVQKNLSLLIERGIQVVQPESGELACGKSGDGRLASIETILNAINDCFLNIKE